MITRLGATGLGVLFCVASLLAPNDTFARSGGGGGHGGTGVSGRAGGIGGRFSAPSGSHSPAARSVTPDSPRTVPSPQHEGHPGFAGPLRHERGFGLPLFLSDGSFLYGQNYAPLPFGSPYYGPFEDGDQSAYADQPPYGERDDLTGAIPPFAHPVVIYRPGCRTQTVTVPSEEGKDQSINIVRC